MGRVLVTERIAEGGLEALRRAGHEVDLRTGLSPAELLEAVKGAQALIVRSATKVTAEVIEAGSALVVVGRAGIGVDNVDVAAATRRGVLVVNAPQSNVLSAAEHTIALLLAQARNIPQAHAALVAGRWERSRWEGVELHGKVLGILGLGRVGALVAQRAASFGMRLVAHDPYVSPERARQMGVELLSLEELLRRSDFVTVHLPKTPETEGLIGEEELALAKPGMRLVNTARGGIVDEAALAAAVAEGRLGGAAVDVFAAEPTTSSPLFGLERVVVTPHLGASTREAQDKAGADIAEQVVAALAGELVPFAVNLPATEVPEALRPWLPLAERLGRLWAALARELPACLDVEFAGGLAEQDTRLLGLAALKGVLAVATGEPVSYVNAAHLAEERGMQVRYTSASASPGYSNLVTLRGGRHAVAGTVFLTSPTAGAATAQGDSSAGAAPVPGRSAARPALAGAAVGSGEAGAPLHRGAAGEPRVVMVDDHDIELPLAPHMLVVRNDDRVGMVAAVASIIAGAGLNIVDLKLGRSATGGTAMMALSFEVPVPHQVVAALRSTPGILEAVALSDV